MTNLADTFPFTGTIPNVSFPVHVGTTAPGNPAIGNAWYNPATGVLVVFTAAGWLQAGSAATGATRLIDLTDVDALAALDKDILVYDATSRTWVATALDLDYGRY